MKRPIVRTAVAVGLLALGWTAGRAQTSAPDFELIVNAPQGDVSVQCVRGCELAWSERGVNPGATRLSTFDFACKGPGQVRCASGRIGGWVKP
jgi:hypothetical protein